MYIFLQSGEQGADDSWKLRLTFLVLNAASENFYQYLFAPDRVWNYLFYVTFINFMLL